MLEESRKDSGQDLLGLGRVLGILEGCWRDPGGPGEVLGGAGGCLRRSWGGSWGVLGGS